MADKNLNIIISAINKSQKEMDNAIKQLNQLDGGIKKANVSNQSMTASFFKGSLAYDAFKKSLGSVVGFLKESIGESIEASRIMAQVETNVKNAGFSYAELSPKIKEYSDAVIKKGFDDETASQSLSKFLLVTKNFGQAQSLTNLAMDLARSKGISLEQATQSLVLVTQGNNRALKEYGIDLGDTATTADILTEAQNKLKGSSDAFLGTSAGKLEVLNQQWGDMKQQIGDGITPNLIEFINIVQENIPAITEIFNTLAKGVGAVVGWVAKLAGNDILKFSDAIVKTISKNQILIDGLIEAEKAGDKNAKGLRLQIQSYNDSEVSLIKLKRAQDLLNEAKKKGYADAGVMNDIKSLSILDIQAPGGVTGGVINDLLNQVNKKIEENNTVLEKNKKAYEEVGKEIEKTGGDLTKLENKVPGAIDPLEKLGEAVIEASKTYEDLKTNATESLDELKEKHSDTMETLSDSIEDVKDNLKDLASSYRNDLANAQEDYANTSTSTSNDIVTAIVANEDAIASLQEKKKQGTITTDEETQLAERLLAEQTNASLIASLSTQIADLKAFNALSELDQAVYNYTTKKALAEQEYNENVARIKSEYKEKRKALQSELNDLNEKKNLEQELYNAKVAFITQSMSDAFLVNKAYSEANLKVTEAQVKAEIAYYNQLAKAVQNAKSGKSTSFSTVSSGISGIKTPTVATSNSSGKVGSIGGNNITINLSGNYYSDDIAQEIGDKIVKTLQLQNPLS